MLGSLILYLEGLRIMMFQLSGFYYKPLHPPFPGCSTKLRTEVLQAFGPLVLPYHNLLFLGSLYTFHIKVYNKSLQKSRVWWVKVWVQGLRASGFRVGGGS